MCVGLVGLPALAEMQIRLKNGQVFTLPVEPDQIEAITFGIEGARPSAQTPKLPPPSTIVNPPQSRSSTEAPPSEGKNYGSMRELRQAVAKAVPGQTITISPGAYILTRGDVLGLGALGTEQQPITLRAETLGSVVLEVEFVEAMRITGAHWIIENLVMIGICGNHQTCEHALHVKPNSHHLTIRNNRLINFNAAIKGSAADAGGATGPSHVIVEGNWIYNERPRDTASPVTPIDVNGGRGWVVRHNYIADFSKLKGNRVSFGAFLKRNSFDGLFEGNLVVCEQRHTGGIRLGLSFGGGGSHQAVEHSNGTIRNNIIMNCPADVGIYVNRAHNTRIYNNILYRTAGIDVRYRQSTVDIRNNVMSGRIKDRNDGSHTSKGDRVGVSEQQFAAWFVNPAVGDFRPRPGSPVIGGGVAAAEVGTDFCGAPRGDVMDQGAIAAGEGDCAMLQRLWLAD